MEICEVSLVVDTTGEAGSATGSQVSKAMHGFLLDISLNYHASAPATTDVTITTMEGSHQVLAVANANADALIAPRQTLVSNANAAITNSHAMFPLNGVLLFSVAGCDELASALVAKVRYLRP